MTNNVQYNLEERTAIFAENVVKFVKTIPENSVTKPILSQLIRSATSIGANYCEADDAESHNDFKHKIGICKKEARETKYWLRILVTALPNVRSQAAVLWQEVKELHLIFAAIVRSARLKK